ncbi:MAG: RAMP superfamily CRISPR-associated protein [Moorellales bacterium]
MHSRFFNEAVLKVRIRPQTPLLIKAGGEGAAAVDPTVPDMSFVRTRRPDGGETVYIPGSSLRGVLRAHAERLVRSVRWDMACDPLARGLCEVPTMKTACSWDTELDLTTYRTKICYACRLFGTTGLASRVRVSDLYPQDNPTCQRRSGVAIDRVTGAVAQGPFDLEVVTDGIFEGVITLRNFTLGQLGLLGATLLDVADGLVPLGFGKSKGFGRVHLLVERISVRTLRDPEGALLGVGAICDQSTREVFCPPPAERERLPVSATVRRERGFYVIDSEGDDARRWLEEAVPRWVEELL